MTATFLPVWYWGRIGLTQPSRKARSAIWYSMCLMVTGLALIDRVQAASHGAGQTRPVISGKLFVEWRFSAASRQYPRYTRSLNSGMRFFTGQPVPWQKGIPQSMQRAACSFKDFSTRGKSISYQSCIRSATGRWPTSTRGNSRKPVDLATVGIRD